MRRRLNQTCIEWGFIALLAGVCLVLSLLQYDWTGEVSRAEAERLRAGLDEQVRQFCNAFDSTLTESCNSLVPDNEAVNDRNRETVHLLRFQKWQTFHPPPIFSRIAIAVPMPGKLALYEQNLTTGELEPIPWPSDWGHAYMQLLDTDRRGPPPEEDPSGTFFIFPVMNRSTEPEPHQPNGPPKRGIPPPAFNHGPESEWVLLQLDTNYLSRTWLPELAKTYLNSSGPLLYDVEVKAILPPRTVIYSSSSSKKSQTSAAVQFNRQGRDSQMIHGTPPSFRWNLEVRSRPGALEAVVAASHHRNLVIAVALNGMIFIAGLALVQLARRSRRLAEAQMNFVAGVSHELRTPLTVIRGAGHNLLHGVASEPDQIEQYSKLIIQNAEQLAQMVEQVLELAGARKNSSASLDSVSIADILREAVSATQHETESAGCGVHLQLSPGLPTVTGDAPALRRVFQNLIINAAKHGGDGGYIGITAVLDEEGRQPEIEIQVADHGPGIPEDEMSEIFKPFFRGATAQATQVRGSGLGLSLVREIVEAHGGAISVESENGTGAIFTVRLPVSMNK